MRMLGCFESNMEGVEIIETVPQIALPKNYSVQDQMDGPHDQGYLGSCVSMCMSDMCKYLFRGTKQVWDKPLEYFYNEREVRYIDGMSPREALDIAVRDGFIKSFAALHSSLPLKHSILNNGPCMICLPVYDTSRDKFWQKRPGENLVGYHAVTFVGYTPDYYVLRNSWGLDFGTKGYTTFENSDLNQILEIWTIFS